MTACLVETGTPRAVAKKTVIAPPAPAQKPPIGFGFKLFWPMVSTMRQPPNTVPATIAE